MQAPQQTPATEAPPPPPALPQQLLPGSLPLPALPKQLSWPQQQQPALDPLAALANAACAADDVATDVRHLLDSLGKTKQVRRHASLQSATLTRALLIAAACAYFVSEAVSLMIAASSARPSGPGRAMT